MPILSYPQNNAVRMLMLKTTLNPPCPSNLNPLPRPFVVTPQHRPARAVRLDQLQLQLRAQHEVLRALRVDGREQVERLGEPLVVRRREVEGDRLRGEGDLGFFLVDLLQVEGGVDRGGGLVEVGPRKHVR